MSSSRSDGAPNAGSNTGTNEANLEFVHQIVANSNQSDVDAAVAAITSAAKHGHSEATAGAQQDPKSRAENESSAAEDVAAIAAAAQAVGHNESRTEVLDKKPATHPKILPRIKPDTASAEFADPAKFKDEEDALKDSQIEKIIESVASSAAAAAANPANAHYMKKKQDNSEDVQSSFASADKLAADLNSIANKKDQFKSEPKTNEETSASPKVLSDKLEISSASNDAGISSPMEKGTFSTHSCSRCKRAFDLPIDGKSFKLCPHCRELQRQRSKRWQQKTREKDGVCRRCGKGIPEDESKFVLCSKCRTTLRDKKANRAELGKCVHCSGPNDPNSQFKVCQRCRNNDKSRRTRLEKDGLCNRCAKPLSPQDKGNYKVCSNCRTRKKRSVDEPTVVVLANNESKIAIDQDSNIINNLATDTENASRKKQKTTPSNGNLDTKSETANSTNNTNSSDNEFIVAERIVQQLQSAAEQAAQVAAQAAKQQEDILNTEKTDSKPADNSSGGAAPSKGTDGVAGSDDANNLFMQPEAAESIKGETAAAPASSKDVTNATPEDNNAEIKVVSK